MSQYYCPRCRSKDIIAFIKNCSLQNIIVNYIRSDRLEDLSYFFDLEVLRYLNEKDKKELYEFLKTNEERYQKRGDYYEREYFNEILGLI